MSTRLVSQSLLLERLSVFPDSDKTFFKLLPMSSHEFYNYNTKCCAAFVLDSSLFFSCLGWQEHWLPVYLADAPPNRHSSQSHCHPTTWKLLPFFFPTKHMEYLIKERQKAAC